MKICKKLIDGGGTFNPNNPIYEKHGVYVADFYKQGGRVAKRKTRLNFWDTV